MRERLVPILLAAGLAACSSPRFAATAEGAAPDDAPHQSVTMTAERYEFTPEEVHVKAGSVLELTITSLDGVHGFKLRDWDVDLRLEPDVPVKVEIYAPTPGTWSFRCSHFCGLGHFGMSGRLVVDP